MPDTFIADVEQWFADELAAIEHDGRKAFRTTDVFNHQVAATASGREAFGRYAPFAFVRHIEPKGKREGDYDLRQVHRFAVLVGAESRVNGAARFGDGVHLGTSRLRDLVITHLDKAHPGEDFNCDQVFYRRDEKALDFPRQHALELLFEVSRIAVTAEEIPLFANCIGLWKMNDNEYNKVVLDSSGGEHHGTSIRNTVYMSDPGKINRCLEFNGVIDKITVPYSPVFNVGGQLSICMWFKTSCSAIELYLFGYSIYRYSLRMPWNDAKDRLLFSLYTESGESIADAWFANDYLRGPWQFVVATYNRALSSDRLKLYLNNQLVATGSGYDEDIIPGGGSIVFGEDAYDGFMDVTAIFNKALSVEEIEWLWNNGSGREDIIDG